MTLFEKIKNGIALSRRYFRNSNGDISKDFIKRANSENQLRVADQILDQNIVDWLANDRNFYKVAAQIRSYNEARSAKYTEYDIMLADSVISAALDLYADCATQVDDSTNRIITVESEDGDLQEDLNTVLKKFEIQDRLRDTAKNLCTYGDWYWKLYTELDENGNIKKITGIEDVDDPETVGDLFKEGKQVGYVQVAENSLNRLTGNKFGYTLSFNNKDCIMYSPLAYVHFCIHSSTPSDIIGIQDYEVIDENGDPKFLEFRLKQGESLLEPARLIWRMVRAVEDSILSASIARSDYTKFINVETGDATEKEQIRIINKIKRIYGESVSLNIRDEEYKAEKRNLGFNQPIFNATNNGKGQVSVTQQGGDIQVRNLAHLDYFNSKLYASLRASKSMLGFDEAIRNSFNAEGAMSQQDIRFNKYVTKVIDSETIGVTQFLNIWLIVNDRANDIGRFKVIYNNPSYTESLVRMKDLSTRIDFIAKYTNTLASSDNRIDKSELFLELMDQYLPYPEFNKKVKDLVRKYEAQNKVDDHSDGIQYDEKGAGSSQSKQQSQSSTPDKDSTDSVTTTVSKTSSTIKVNESIAKSKKFKFTVEEYADIVGIKVSKSNTQSGPDNSIGEVVSEDEIE